MGLLKKASIAAAVLASLLGPSSVNVASADTGPSDVVSVIGGGNIFPGLPTTGCASSAPHITFAGTPTFTPHSDDTNLSGVPNGITFTGDSTSGCASLTADSGSGTLGGEVSGNVSFTRTGNVVEVSGTATLNGELHTITAECEFVPNNANPTTSYNLTCQAVLNS